MITYIALGSNLNEPFQQLQKALESLKQHSDIKLLKCSSFYHSKALVIDGSVPQPDYINAVAKLETSMSPLQLLEQLNEIEDQQGRERKEKWGARTLDLDILLYDEQLIQTDRLVIPHSQLAFRNFVIHPLFEVAGAITIPGLGDLSQLAQKMNWDGIELINEKMF